MRVFCHEHKKGFFAPRQSPIRCENSGHVLGTLDFSGSGKSIGTLQWQYCCNCEHFCLIDFDGGGVERCPVCTRRSSVLHLCDNCYTISFEATTPLDSKNFTVTPEGAPSPCCPGCLQQPNADLNEHSCDEMGATFVTALSICPLCNERLDVQPSFPATVAEYLKQTRSANKLFVTFDYESELFVPIEDGEFVLIRVKGDSEKTVLLPRSPNLNDRRDFYELYQDYYYCDAPSAGEIYIHEPALVVPLSDGWKLLMRGRFRSLNNQEDQKIPPPRPLAQSHIEPEPPSIHGEGVVINCTNCGTPIEAKYAFCWQCGSARPEKDEALRVDEGVSNGFNSGSRPSRLIVSTDEDEDEDEVHTVQHEPRAPRSSIFETRSIMSKEQSGSTGSLLKLFGFGVGAFLLISVALFALLRPRSSPAVAANEPAAIEQSQPAAIPEETSPRETKPTPEQAASVSAEDTALERLRQMTTDNSASDRSRILRNLSLTERKYSEDYRFPYERARIVAVDHNRNYRKEAFAALNRAAEKAINHGKATEMLESLDKDSDGDFQQLARSRREWANLQKALRRKDVGALSLNEGL